MVYIQDNKVYRECSLIIESGFVLILRKILVENNESELNFKGAYKKLIEFVDDRW